MSIPLGPGDQMSMASGEWAAGCEVSIPTTTHGCIMCLEGETSDPSGVLLPSTNCTLQDPCLRREEVVALFVVVASPLVDADQIPVGHDQGQMHWNLTAGIPSLHG
jgi:hypothetical protein